MPEGSTSRRKVRCAVYTRKSTEEGLDSSFNSLDAQREACIAYIASQRHEGWELVREHFDDGGFSGGNMQRPALQRLMDLVEDGRVDVIVCYKVDRLSRSLSDFVKIVEKLDAASASFCSITQQFNTTSSMGRLTLNVLLSFAQFEREVIAERVRDKVAASKAKGMWLGGRVPVGYDAIDRRLVINEAEAETVRSIFQRYLELKAVPALIADLKSRGIVTKVERRRDGTTSGGIPYTRGALYHLLKNPLYLGKVTHKDRVYEGEHEAIIEQPLFDRVQQQLVLNKSERARGAHAQSPTLLAGLIRDEFGRPMSPHHAVKDGRRYQYYVSNEPEPASTPSVIRLPARELDQAVLTTVSDLLRGPNLMDVRGMSADQLRKFEAAKLQAAKTLLSSSRPEQRYFLRAIDLRLIVHRRHIEASCCRPTLLKRLGVSDGDGLPSRCALAITKRPVGQHGLRLCIEHRASSAQREDKLTDMLVRGNAALEGLTNTTKLLDREERRDLNRLARAAFLAPDIVEAILAGSQPPGVSVRHITRSEGLPLDWSEQRSALGFSSVGAAKTPN